MVGWACECPVMMAGEAVLSMSSVRVGDVFATAFDFACAVIARMWTLAFSIERQGVLFGRGRHFLCLPLCIHPQSTFAARRAGKEMTIE